MVNNPNSAPPLQIFLLLGKNLKIFFFFPHLLPNFGDFPFSKYLFKIRGLINVGICLYQHDKCLRLFSIEASVRLYNIWGLIMCDTDKNSLDYSKNRLDAVSMVMNKKDKAIAINHNLPEQFQDPILPNLQELNFKADKLKFSDFEAIGVDFSCKFYNPNLQKIEPQEIKKEKTIWDKLRLFVAKQSTVALFQFIIMYFPQFLPQIVFLIFSLVLVVLSW
jgi:hypothetical protein